MIQAYGYIRTSSTGQLKHSSPERQEEKIRSFAQANDIEIAEIFIEDISGTVDYVARPVFNDMVSKIITNGVDHVLVEDLRAIARKSAVQDQILSYFVNKDIHLINCETGSNVTEDFQKDDTNKAMIQIQGVFLEWEKNRVVARLQRGRQITGHKGGRPSYYSKDLKKRIHRLRGKGRSYGVIADIFNVEEISTSTGRPWTAQSIRIVGGPMEVKKTRPPRRIPKTRIKKGV